MLVSVDRQAAFSHVVVCLELKLDDYNIYRMAGERAKSIFREVSELSCRDSFVRRVGLVAGTPLECR